MIINNLTQGPGEAGSAPWDFSYIILGLSSLAIASVVIRKYEKKYGIQII